MSLRSLDPYRGRMGLYLAALLVLAFAWTAWSLLRLGEARAAARGAARDLADCGRLEGEITRLRARPAAAVDRERRSGEVAGPIEKAAREAGVPTERVARISPEPAERAGETDYNRKPTRVLLKNVTLRQVGRMAHALGAGPAGLDLESLRLTAPSRDATEGTWSAELVFVYLVYEPQGARP